MNSNVWKRILYILSGALIGALSVGYYFTVHQNPTPNEPVYQIGNRVVDPGEAFKQLYQFDSESMENFVRNLAVFEALNETYGSEFVDEQVNRAIQEEIEFRGLNENDPTVYIQLGYNNRSEMENHYRLRELIDRYTEDQLDEESVRSYYNDWQPAFSVVVVPRETLSDEDELLKEWETVDEKSAEKLFKFLRDRDITFEGIDLPYHQRVFEADEYQNILELNPFDSTVVSTPGGEGEILVFLMGRKEKTDFETDREAVKADMMDAMKRNEQQFIQQLLSDLDIKLLIEE